MPCPSPYFILGPVLALLSAGFVQADTWPQWRGEKRDGIWRETGLIDSFPEEGLKRAWTVPVGPGYCGPTVTENHIYLMDRGLDPAIEEERILCFDRHTGEISWTVSYPCVYEGVSYDVGPRASVTVSNGFAYALGTMGDLHALDARSGEMIWKRNLVDEFQAEIPTWGVSSAPLVVSGRVIVQSGGPEGPSALALNTITGEEIWRGPVDRMSYSAPTSPPNHPGEVLVWSDSLFQSLSIENGDVLWSVESPKVRAFVARVQSPVFDASGESFLLSDFNDGTRRYRRSGSVWEEVWHVRGKNERNTEGLHSLMGAPVWIRDHFYGVDSYGTFLGLRASDSVRVWETDTVVPLTRWATAFPVRQGEDGNRVWILNEVGELLLTELTPEGYSELDRTPLIEPTQEVRQRDYLIVWSHPAFAHRHIYARNDKELIAVSVAKDGVNGPEK
ncbi:MAG: PQQ-binding-like beta-propeller repeat protein [Verrucomicrobiota bacterium]